MVVLIVFQFHIFSEAVFCLQAKKLIHTGVRTGRHYLTSLSVCQCVFNIRRFC